MDPAPTQDSTLLLDDFLLAHVFSFLGGGDGSPTTTTTVSSDPHRRIAIGIPGIGNEGVQVGLTTVQDAARLHGLLAGVCPRWRQVCQRHLPRILGLLHATVAARDRRWMQPWLDAACIEWMCRHHVRIGVLPCVLWLSQREVSLLVRLLDRCDTSQLNRLWVSFAIDFWESSGKPETMRLQGVLYDAIARNCPSLEEASIGCHLSLGQPGPGGIDPYDHFKAFFSMPSLRRLRWTVDFRQTKQPALASRLGTALLTRLISNLPALERLELQGQARQFLDGCLPVRSDNLRVLGLSQLRLDGKLDVLCLCPRLCHIELPPQGTQVEHFVTDQAFQAAMVDFRGEKTG